MFLRLLHIATYTIYIGFYTFCIDFSSLVGKIISTDDFRDYFMMIWQGKIDAS
jgi:hypothetical protein